MLRNGHVSAGRRHRNDRDRMVPKVFPVIRGVPAVGPSAIGLERLSVLAPPIPPPIEQDLDSRIVEESDAGPEEEL